MPQPKGKSPWYPWIKFGYQYLEAKRDKLYREISHELCLIEQVNTYTACNPNKQFNIHFQKYFISSTYVSINDTEWQ
jgi:hypothetical protein